MRAASTATTAAMLAVIANPRTGIRPQLAVQLGLDVVDDRSQHVAAPSTECARRQGTTAS